MGGHKAAMSYFWLGKQGRKGNFGIVTTSSTSELMLIRSLASVGGATFHGCWVFPHSKVGNYRRRYRNKR